MIKNLTKNVPIIFAYIFYISYIFIKSTFFYKFKITPTDYLINFQSGSCYIIELLPMFIIILFLLLKNDNVYYNYRLQYRNSIVKKQYKKIVVHAVIFVSLNFIISILLFNSVYKFFIINPVNYYIFLAIIHILGYMVIGGAVLLLNQINSFKDINSFIFIYVLFAIEYFIFYESMLSEKIPIIISWVFVDKSLFLRIVILAILNIGFYSTVCNKSLNREFV